MGIRSYTIPLLPLALCALLGAAAGQEKKQKPNSIESLFEGLPADLRKNLENNAVRRDRVNNWLKEHVNGKGKTIEVRVPVEIIPRRAKDGTYPVLVNVNESNAIVRPLGEKWSLGIIRRPVAQTKGGAKDKVGKGGKGATYFRGLVFVGVSPADAEKLSDLKKVTIQGKVREMELKDRFATLLCVCLFLEDVRLDGMKLTPPKPAAEK